MERLRLLIENLVNDRAFYDEGNACPGFHIFLANGEERRYEDVATSAHFDLQGSQIIPDAETLPTLTFTVPIELPIGGASLETWPINLQSLRRLNVSTQHFTSKYQSQMIEYHCGRAVLHDGLILHALGRAPGGKACGMRITLQGHSVRLPQGWMIYW